MSAALANLAANDAANLGGFVFNDGGRSAAGFKGDAGDCVARAIAITTGLPYREVYDRLAEGNATQRRTRRQVAKGRTARRSARDGIYTSRKWFQDYMASLGFTWVSTMGIGTGCQVHLRAEELPAGRLVVKVSRHLCAVLDGVIHDTFDPRRETHCTEPYNGQALRPGQEVHPDGKIIRWVERRCVYGYWRLDREVAA